MAGELQNTTILKSNTFSKGMIKDIDSMYLPDGFWNHAVNAINNAHYGAGGGIGNEPANIKSGKAPYTIIGFVYKDNGEWVLFSTTGSSHDDIDGTISDIGIFNESTNIYKSIFEEGDNVRCLNFSVVSPITGACKENYDQTWSVYWQDGHNVDRVINLDNPPYIKDPNNVPCEEVQYYSILDCDAIRLHPLVKQPCLKIKKSIGGGQLINGSYMAVIAYTENKIRLTDYSMPSAPIGLWTHEGLGGSIEVETLNLDDSFEQFELVIIAVTNQQTIAKRIGYYPIHTSNIHLDQVLQSLETVDISLIPMKNVVYEKSNKMFEIGNYLIRSGVTSQPYFNYQPLANKIKVYWVAVKYPKTYYFEGGTSVGFMRDEVYSFFIRWVYKTGARSASYHIPGREISALDDTSISDNNPNKVYSNETKRWQVYDTSNADNTGLAETIIDDTPSNGVIYKSGLMGYHESTEKYPSDPEIWGSLCNQPIRHHKMPSDETIEISGMKNNNEYIYVLGVKFEKIERPKDRDEKYIEDIIGYEILRGSREGNKSIIAKGIFNNMMEYDIFDSSTKGLIQNYPYNDLSEPFLCQNMQHMTNADKVPVGISGSAFKKNIFTFHSPDTNFIKPYLGNNYIKISKIARGNSVGNFSIPYKYPKHKIVTRKAFNISIPIAIGIGLSAALGKTNLTSSKGVSFVVNANWGNQRPMGSSTALGDSIAGIASSFTSGAFLHVGSIMSGIIIMAANFMSYFATGMTEALEAIKNISRWRDYVLQFDSHGLYRTWENVGLNHAPETLTVPSIRRSVSNIKYIGSHVQSFNSNYRINNINRNKYVAIQTTKDIEHIVGTYRDNSKVRVQNHLRPFEEITRYITSYYGAIKIDYENQYGQLDSIVQLPTNSCVYEIESNTDNKTGVVFGGDTYINRYTEKNPYMFFNTWLYDNPNGTELNYRNYVNGPVPRYWVDTTAYDMADSPFNFEAIFNQWFDGAKNKDTELDDTSEYFGEEPVITVPRHFYNFDEDSNSSNRGYLIVKNSYAYLFYNGVRDFFVESEMNLAYRDYGEEDWQKYHDTHYDNHFSSLDIMFRSDLITKSIYHKYDNSLSASKIYSGHISWGTLLPREYNPAISSTSFEYLPRRVVYSLRQIEKHKKDNWRVYLPLNKKDFKGVVSTIKSLNATGAIMLFEDKEPVFFQGVDQLESKSGNKFTVGDGGLFTGLEQTMVNADDSMGYANCTSSRSAINTPYGAFWVSQDSGKIFQYTGRQAIDITKYGMTYWFNQYLPSQLLEQYPNYPHYDNPIIGVGCQAIYDSQYELIYFMKKDYKPLKDDLIFDKETPFIVSEDDNKTKITLYNTQYFEDASWVASFDPKSNSWISFHTWKPSLAIPSLNHFYTVDSIKSLQLDLNLSSDYNYETGSTLWKHNESIDNFCRYYDENSYWEIDYPISTGNQVATLKSVEYQLECFRLAKHEYDKAHQLDENFDRAIVYNSEQISGWLHLEKKPRNNPYEMIAYPKYTLPNMYYNIIYSKEENRYRFNQFWDIVRDRESNPSLFITSSNGVNRIINILSVDYEKAILERKRFRHYANNILLRRISRDDKGIMPKMIFKTISNKLLNSPR